MPGPKVYATAGAFRRALENRLKRIAHEEKVDVNRLRRQVAFDRLLARLFLPDQAPWVLKGGYALELIFDKARATIDIDLTLPTAADKTTASRFLGPSLLILDSSFLLRGLCGTAEAMPRYKTMGKVLLLVLSVQGAVTAEPIK